MRCPRLELDIEGNDQPPVFANGTCPNPETLSPCPHCGGTELEMKNDGDPHYFVACLGCGAQGPDGYPIQPHEGVIDSVILCRRLHQQAFDEAVARWERRL